MNHSLLPFLAGLLLGGLLAGLAVYLVATRRHGKSVAPDRGPCSNAPDPTRVPVAPMTDALASPVVERLAPAPDAPRRSPTAVVMRGDRPAASPALAAPDLGAVPEPVIGRAKPTPETGPEDGLVAVGPHATVDELRTTLPVDIALRRSGDHWLISTFDVGTVQAYLGEIPLGPGSPAITTEASVLRLVDGGAVETVDLASHAIDPHASLRGGSRLPGGRIGTLPGVVAWQADATVTAIRVDMGGLEASTQAAVRARIGPTAARYPLSWAGSAEEYVKALRLDLLQALGWWPLAPPGCDVAVAACGPGHEGPVLASTSPSLVLASDDSGYALFDRSTRVTAVEIDSGSTHPESGG